MEAVRRISIKFGTGGSHYKLSAYFYWQNREKLFQGLPGIKCVSLKDASFKIFFVMRNMYVKKRESHICIFCLQYFVRFR